MRVLRVDERRPRVVKVLLVGDGALPQHVQVEGAVVHVRGQVVRLHPGQLRQAGLGVEEDVRPVAHEGLLAAAAAPRRRRQQVGHGAAQNEQRGLLAEKFGGAGLQAFNKDKYIC